MAERGEKAMAQKDRFDWLLLVIIFSLLLSVVLGAVAKRSIMWRANVKREILRDILRHEVLGDKP